ncbi:hypothetical protein SK128_018379, partial [Halocaridina rubra]
DNLQVHEQLDGIIYNKIEENTLKKVSEDIQHISSTATWNCNISFAGNTLLSYVNSKEWTSHLDNVIKQNFTGMIHGRKTFSLPVNITQNLNVLRVNDTAFAQFWALIFTKSGNQTVHGNFTFDSSVTSIAVLSPEINGNHISDLLYLDDVHQFSTSVTFAENVTFLANISTPSDIVNDCNMTELEQFSHLVDERSKSEFYVPLHTQQLHVHGNISAVEGIFLGENKSLQLLYLLKSLVLSSSDQEITGKQN